MVGIAARIRVSSVIVLPSSGTFKSARTSTNLPFKSDSVKSPTLFFAAFVTVSVTQALQSKALARRAYANTRRGRCPLTLKLTLGTAIFLERDIESDCEDDNDEVDDDTTFMNDFVLLAVPVAARLLWCALATVSTSRRITAIDMMIVYLSTRKESTQIYTLSNLA